MVRKLLGDVELSQSGVDALGIVGRVALGLAEIALHDRDRAFADAIRYGTVDGRRATIRVAPATSPRASNVGTAFDAAVVAFQGIVRAINPADGQSARLSLVDIAERLVTTLQPSRYLGTGGIEGVVALKGRPKPVCLGRVFNVSPIFLGNVDLGNGSLPTYQSHWRAISAHDAVRIRGASQTGVVVLPTVGSSAIGLPLACSNLAARQRGR